MPRAVTQVKIYDMQCDVQEMPYQASVASVRPVCPEKEAEWHSSKTLAFSQAL